MLYYIDFSLSVDICKQFEIYRVSTNIVSDFHNIDGLQLLIKSAIMLLGENF